MTKPAEVAATGAGDIWRIIHGFSTYWLVVAALEIGVFDALAEGPLPSNRLDERLAVDRGRCRTLIDGLVVAGLLEREGEFVRLAGTSEHFLVRGRGTYLGELVRWSPGRWENWAALGATVRGATPPAVADASLHTNLAPATFPAQYRAAIDLARRLAPMAEPLRILDLGAGAAPWTIALLEAFPHATAVINDFEPVLSIAVTELEAHGVRERVRLLPGDYWTVDLPEATLVVLGHVCRAEGDEAAARLVKRAAATLVEGGRMVVADYFVDDDRRESITPRMMGVTMLANTTSGGTFTYGEFRDWLHDASLRDVELLRVGAFTEVLVATKRGTK